ncbi:hypothetical protein KR054_001509, partial [Drosophila jambulina]
RVHTKHKMLKATSEQRRVPAAARYTSGRALLSAYCPKPSTFGDGKGSLAGGSVKVAAKAPLPRVWSCNKPKILKSFNVYAKQASRPISKEVKSSVRRWVDPPYPVDRPKTEKQSEGPRNYDTLYVPLDDSSKEEQQSFRKFPCLLPAGERHSLKVQANNSEMAKLIAEVMEIRQKLCLEYEPPLPPPPQFAGEFQPLPLVRSRTFTYFSVCEEAASHPKLHEYVRRLPRASTPITP